MKTGKLFLFLGLLICNSAKSQTISPTTIKQSPVTQQAYIPRVTGYVDMHTHPMAHLAFGGKVLYGAPDEQAPNLPGTIYKGFNAFEPECNTRMEPGGSMARALANCNAMHGGPGVDNDCGNLVRKVVVNMVDQIYDRRAKTGPDGLLGVDDHPHGGFPSFTDWPRQTTVTHQQMWYEWIKRAYQGGLRIMVSLAVNNGLLASAARANPGNSAAGPGEFIDDKSSVELQLTEMRNFVRRHSDFMEIAKSPADALRIIRSNKLAVVLGVETDDLGNFAKRSFMNKENITLPMIKAELERLYYEFDVRYIFPIHFSNNIFGGAAINNKLFALTTKYYTNSYVQIEDACGIGVGYKHEKQEFEGPQTELLKLHDMGWVLNNQPNYPAPSAGCGHINKTGLRGIGASGIVEMMKLGMMIDVDHMSQKSMAATINLARLYRGGYPLSAGHTGVREAGGNERNLFKPFADSITKLGGLIGIGTANKIPDNFIRDFNNVYEAIGRRLNIAIGTDANGLEPLPKASAGLNPNTFYNNFNLPKLVSGREWNYVTEGGVAHYGLLPEYIHDVRGRPGGAQVANILNGSADQFIRMWEKCEALNQRTR